MKHLSFLGVAIVLVTMLAACNGSTTGSAAVPSAAPTSAASIGPVLTPAPSGLGAPSGAPSDAASASQSVAPSAAASPGETMLVRAYFVLGGEPGVVGLLPILRTVPKAASVATAAMDALLAGTTATESGDRQITSAIPSGTRLLGLVIKGGVATVDLSAEFGASAAAASMRYRLAQVVYTVTQFSTAKSVAFKIDGTTVTTFGSDISLSGPTGRADYYDQLPAIFVDRPAYRAAIGNPARVTGNANVFEATFHVAILDASGKILVDQQVMATCGTGCRGTFDVTLMYVVAKAQYGTLRAYDLSAKDGKPEDVRDYSVWLTPAG